MTTVICTVHTGLQLTGNDSEICMFLWMFELLPCFYSINCLSLVEKVLPSHLSGLVVHHNICGLLVQGEMLNVSSSFRV